MLGWVGGVGGGGGRGYFLPEIYDANILSTTAQVHIVLVPAPWPNSAQCDNVVRVGACSVSGLTFIERLCHCAPVFSLNSTDITSYAETSYETKRPTDKTSHGQPYVIQTKHPRNKTPYRTNIPQTKRPKGKNILLTKRGMGQTVLIFLIWQAKDFAEICIYLYKIISNVSHILFFIWLFL